LAHRNHTVLARKLQAYLGLLSAYLSGHGSMINGNALS